MPVVINGSDRLNSGGFCRSPGLTGNIRHARAKTRLIWERDQGPDFDHHSKADDRVCVANSTRTHFDLPTLSQISVESQPRQNIHQDGVWTQEETGIRTARATAIGCTETKELGGQWTESKTKFDFPFHAFALSIRDRWRRIHSRIFLGLAAGQKVFGRTVIRP